MWVLRQVSTNYQHMLEAEDRFLGVKVSCYNLGAVVIKGVIKYMYIVRRDGLYFIIITLLIHSDYSASGGGYQRNWLKSHQTGKTVLFHPQLPSKLFAPHLHHWSKYLHGMSY